MCGGRRGRQESATFSLAMAVSAYRSTSYGRIYANLPRSAVAATSGAYDSNPTAARDLDQCLALRQDHRYTSTDSTSTGSDSSATYSAHDPAKRAASILRARSAKAAHALAIPPPQ